MPETTLSAIKGDKSISVVGGHFEEAEDYLKADLCIVVTNEEMFYFSDQTPMWNRHNVMFAHTGGDTDKGRLYFTEWE